MTTETIPQTLPDAWEPEPFVPAISVSLIVVPATPLDTFDFAPAHANYRVVGLHIGGLSLHVGGPDADRLAVADRLIEALQTLRAAALKRMASES